MNPLVFHLLFPTDDGTNRTMSIAFGVWGQGATVMQQNSPEGPDWFDLALNALEKEMSDLYGLHDRTVINDADALTVLYRCMETEGVEAQEHLAADWKARFNKLCGEVYVTELISFFQRPNDPPFVGRALFDHLVKHLGLVEPVEASSKISAIYDRVGPQSDRREMVEQFFAETIEAIAQEIKDSNTLPAPRRLEPYFADRLDGSYSSDRVGHFTHDLWNQFSENIEELGLRGTISTTIRHGAEAGINAMLSFSHLPVHEAPRRPSHARHQTASDPVAELLGFDFIDSVRQ